MKSTLPTTESRTPSHPHAPVRLIIVDDEELIRDAFCLLVEAFPEVTVVGEAATGEEALALVAELRPRMVLMDLRLPGMDGVAAARRIREEWPETLVIAVTGVTDGLLLMAAVELGLAGYILKRATRQELHLAITMAIAGRRYVCPEITEAVTAHHHYAASPLDPVSRREAEVLDLLCRGVRSKKIAERLEISIRTVEKHLGSLRRKYRTDTTMEMVTIYQRELLGEGGAR